MCKKDTVGLIKLFVLGWFQVFLIAINTYQIANGKLAGAFVVGFGISLVWTLNVKSVAFGMWRDRVAYSVGAAFGTASGMILMSMLY